MTNTAAQPTLTAASLELFLALANDAGNWGGTPLVEVTPAERGNLTQIKRAGLLTTGEDDGCVFAWFTPAGVAFAGQHDVDLSWI